MVCIIKTILYELNEDNKYIKLKITKLLIYLIIFPLPLEIYKSKEETYL